MPSEKNVVREGGLWPFKSRCQKVKVALNRADCFSFEIRVYEETAIDVNIYKVIHDILNPMLCEV